MAANSVLFDKILPPRALGCERPAFYTGIVIITLFVKYVKMIVEIVYEANLSMPYFG